MPMTRLSGIDRLRTVLGEAIIPIIAFVDIDMHF